MLSSPSSSMTKPHEPKPTKRQKTQSKPPSKPEERKLTPEEDSAISGIHRWQMLKGWPKEPQAVAEVVNCVLRYCLSAEAIKACITHFSEEREWIPTEYDIRIAAHERAWGSSPLTLLRKAAQDCEYCAGSGMEPVTMKKRNAITGNSEDVQAMGYCRCEYGQARRKVVGS